MDTPTNRSTHPQPCTTNSSTAVRSTAVKHNCRQQKKQNPSTSNNPRAHHVCVCNSTTAAQQNARTKRSTHPQPCATNSSTAVRSTAVKHNCTQQKNPSTTSNPRTHHVCVCSSTTAVQQNARAGTVQRTKKRRTNVPTHDALQQYSS